MRTWRKSSTRINPELRSYGARQRRSVGFQPAVSPVSNRRAAHTFTRPLAGHVLPTGSRRHSRLETCATNRARLNFGIRVNASYPWAGNLTRSPREGRVGVTPVAPSVPEIHPWEGRFQASDHDFRAWESENRAPKGENRPSTRENHGTEGGFEAFDRSFRG